MLLVKQKQSWAKQVSVLAFNRLRIIFADGKMPNKENLSLEEKEQLVETVHAYPCLLEKIKKNVKVRMCRNLYGDKLLRNQKL